jgi:hypothetical protein
MSDLVSLNEWLSALRGQILAANRSAEAARAADPSAPTFRMRDIELEVAIASRGAAAAEGGVKLWVVNTKVKGEVESTTTHRLRMRLELNESKDIVLGRKGNGKAAKPKSIVSAPGDG